MGGGLTRILTEIKAKIPTWVMKVGGPIFRSYSVQEPFRNLSGGIRRKNARVVKIATSFETTNEMTFFFPQYQIAFFRKTILLLHKTKKTDACLEGGGPNNNIL